MFSFFRITRGEDSEIRGNFIRLAREVVADDLPTIPRVGRFEKLVGRKIKGVRFERRKNHRQRARIAIFAAANWLGRNFRVLADILPGAREPIAIQSVRVQRIHGDVAVLENSRQPPIAKGNFAVIAAALRRDRTAFLLRAVNPIRKTIVRGQVIELRRRLVVPSAPGRTAVHANDRALIGAERDNLRIFPADPDALVTVAAGRAFESHKCFSAVRGFPRGGVRHVNHVRIVRRNSDAHRARAAAPDSAVAVYLLPGLARIVRAIDSRAFRGFRQNLDSLRIAWRNGNPDSPEAFRYSRQSFGQRLPGLAAIRRFIQPAPGYIDGGAAANLPRRNTRGPQCRVNRLRIRGIESKIGSAGVFVLVEDVLENLPAIGGAEDAALGVGTVGVPFGGDENTVGIFRVDKNRGDLLRVA